MPTATIVEVYREGLPVGLSSGVRLLEDAAGIPAADIVVQTPDRGGLRFKIGNPSPGPLDPFWAQAQYAPAHPGDRRAFVEAWRDTSKTVDFRALSGPVNQTAVELCNVPYRYPSVFWVEDPEGEFMLMEHETRKLVRVSPLPDAATGHFWQMVGLTDAGTTPGCLYKAGDAVPTSWSHPSSAVWALAGVGTKYRVYFCIHPCPAPKNHHPLWGWGGNVAVLIPWPDDRPCEEYVLAQRHEQTLGRLILVA